MNILIKADEIVNKRMGEQASSYGDFHECNIRAAELASIMIQKKITGEDIYFIMVALKLARQSFSHKEDNLLDAVAYLAALNNYKNDTV
jgi:hypothetical protein